MTATTAPGTRRQRLPTSTRRQHLVDRLGGFRFFCGDVILDPADGVLERGGVRRCGLAREVGPPDEAVGIPVNSVARVSVLACNRFRQQCIIIHGHGLPLKLPDGRRVLDPALRPQCVQSAWNAELGLRSDVSLINFAVVADRATARRPTHSQGPVAAKSPSVPTRRRTSGLEISPHRQSSPI